MITASTFYIFYDVEVTTKCASQRKDSIPLWNFRAERAEVWAKHPTFPSDFGRLSLWPWTNSLPWKAKLMQAAKFNNVYVDISVTSACVIKFGKVLFLFWMETFHTFLTGENDESSGKFFRGWMLWCALRAAKSRQAESQRAFFLCSHRSHNINIETGQQNNMVRCVNINQ